VTNFGYWADRVPDGQFLCCLCFEAFPTEQAWMDADGQRWDMCDTCGESERIAGEQDELRMCADALAEDET
jgi:hypothetical protein